MHAVVLHLKAHSLRHLLVMSIVLGMLLVPATCANAAGPHSLFMSPTANTSVSMHHSNHHAQSDDSGMNMSGMSADDHATHMSMDHEDLHSDGDVAESTAANESAMANQGDGPAEQPGVRLTDLPSTMAIAAVSNPASIAELDAIQFPLPSIPATPRSTNALSGRAILLELPPPR